MFLYTKEIYRWISILEMGPHKSCITFGGPSHRKVLKVLVYLGYKMHTFMCAKNKQICIKKGG